MKPTQDGSITVGDEQECPAEFYEVCECGHKEISDGYGGNDCPDCGKRMAVVPAEGE